MGQWVELVADDGHRLDCYSTIPETEIKGGLVVIQEIFGVNAHIRAVAEGFAKEGFAVAAPSLFDRLERHVELDYTPEGVANGRKMRVELGWDRPATDLKAAIDYLRKYGKVATVGYCWGGSLAWLSACRLSVAASVSYYGGQIVQLLEEKPKCPLMLHFGEKDDYIPPSDIEKIKASFPSAEVYIYNAGHGFSCEARADYHPESAEVARARTIDFLEKSLITT